jgi:methionyl-tRNA synthetase
MVKIFMTLSTPLCSAGNKYMDDAAPWSLFKDGKMEEGCKVLLTIRECMHVATRGNGAKKQFIHVFHAQ